MSKQKKDSVKKDDPKKLKKEIQELALLIDKVEDEKLEIQNQLKKALADYANLERDNEKRMDIRMVQLKSRLAMSLMPVMDDISFAMKASENLDLDEKGTAWLEGLKGVLGNISKSLGDMGVENIEVAVGDPFDSSLHEAIGVIHEGKENSIHEVVQPGFKLGDVVVRPVRVIVSKGKK